jgi:ankyrin repeat protein
VFLNIFIHASEKSEENFQRFIESILKNVYTKAAKRVKIGHECKICYYKRPIILETACRHQLCAGCMKTISYQGKFTCPLCRSTIFPTVNNTKVFLSTKFDDISTNNLQLEFGFLCTEDNLEQITKLFLENKDHIDMNAQGLFGMTPLDHVLKSGGSKVFKFLVEHGVDINETEALKIALKNKNFKLFKFLLEIFVVNISSISLLMVVQEGHIEMFDWMMQNDKNLIFYEIDDKGSTYLHVAAQSGYVNIVKLLINGGADIEKRGYLYKTPLFESLLHEQEDVTKFLIENGADFTKRFQGETPLHIASSYRSNLSLVKFLINRGADIDSLNDNNETSLYLALKHGYPRLSLSIFSYLVKETNCDINLGKSLLVLAFEINDQNLVKFFLTKGVHVEQTSIDLAFEKGYLQIANYLMQMKKNDLLTKLAVADEKFQEIANYFQSIKK